MGSAASREAKQPGPRDDAASTSSSSSCPVPEEFRHAAVYNVYNQRIDGSSAAEGSTAADLLDPTNNMPLQPNQQPCPGQRKLLSTERLQSNIPKGGTSSTWLYPSPQMFYNALKRKGKGSDVAEDDMDSVVHAHNSMNEATWQRVQAWEALHRARCGQAQLLRFRGRPDDLSPLARLRSWLGGPLPFDRHDWYVERCGREVRYVIDFYFDEARAGSPDAFEVVVRPALDSPGAALDRLKMQIYTAFAAYGLPCPVSGESSSLARDSSEAVQQSGGRS